MVIFLLIVLLIVIYLLFAPFYLEINTITGLCRIRFHHLASASLLIADRSLKFNIRIVLWEKQVDLLAERKRGKTPPSRKIKRKFSFSKGKALLRSFKINKCHLTIDTGQMTMNGILYPIFYGSNKYTDTTIEINFLDENEIILEIKNNLARMIRAYIFS